MRTGVVRWFSVRLGYGYIASEDEPDLYFQQDQVVMPGCNVMQGGDAVTYELQRRGGGRWWARNVRPVLATRHAAEDAWATAQQGIRKLQEAA